MRVLARIGCTLAALALLAPAGARAGLPVEAGAPWSPAQQPKKASKPGLLKSVKNGVTQSQERLCADCRRAKLMADQGVSVPPPPPLPPGTVIKANMCTVCGRPAAVLAGRLTPSMLAGGAAGRAVVGGEAGYASIGNEPAPIGVVQPQLASAAPSGPARSRDASVMPTSVSSPSDPVMPQHHSRPHIISHLLGLSALGRDRAEYRERAAEEEHASIPYGAISSQPVQNVPASMVYGR